MWWKIGDFLLTVINTWLSLTGLCAEHRAAWKWSQHQVCALLKRVVVSHRAFHTSLGLHFSPTFTLQATGREGRSVQISQDEESGLTYRDPAAINLQSFSQHQSWVKKHRIFWLSLRSCSASQMAFLGQSKTQSTGAGGAGIQQPATDSCCSRNSFCSFGFLSSLACTNSSR